jgi:tetratricopeptide (TPR) repeat protein
MQPEIQELFREVETLVQAGQLGEAEQALSEIAELARLHSDAQARGVALADLASVQAELKKPELARQNWRDAAAVLEQTPGGEWELVRSVYWPMARYSRDENEPMQAAEAYQAAVVVLERLAPGSEEYSIHLSSLLADWARWQSEQGQNEAAEAAWGKAVGALAQFESPSRRLQDEFAAVLEGHAEALSQLGRAEEAAAPLRRARAIYEAMGCSEGVVASLVSLARALWSHGDREESRRLASDAASRAEEAADAQPAVRGEAFENQARFLLAEGKHEEADTYFQLAEILYRRQAEEDDPDEWIVPLQMVVAQRATLLIQRRDVRGAAAVVQELVDFWLPYLDEDPARRMATFLMPAQRLAQLYQTLGETAKAEAVAARVRELQAA